jgi:HEPN domain-containing protein
VNWQEQAVMLLAKAREDLYLVRSHSNDAHVSDEMWGFHAQQAVEKLLKSILSSGELRYPFTHRLRDLAGLLKDKLPSKFDPLLDLSPYAVELRYAMLPRRQNAAPLDRAQVLVLLEALFLYVSCVVGEQP